jgi:hypothetical protein
MLNVAGYFSYVSVVDNRLCFLSKIMYRAIVFILICVLHFVISIREVHGLSAFEVQMVI